MVMSLYSIQDTTLTALGDAVRSKALGSAELHIIRGETGEITFNGEVPIQLPNYVIKMRVKGHKTTINEGYKEVYQGIGIAPGYYDDEYKARMDAGYFVIEGSDTYDFDFDILVEGNALTFLCSYRDTNYGSMSITYEIIGLDENGNEFKYTPLEMVDKINGLMAIPDETLNITGNCKYRFAYNNWNWFIEKYGDRITTKDIIDPAYMFVESGKLETIPFDINLNNASSISNMFYYCSKLKNIPMIYGAKLDGANGYVFYNCAMVQHFPEHFAEDWDFTGLHNYQYGGMNNLFNSCCSLRTPPTAIINNFRSKTATSYSCCYANTFSSCFSLDDINGVDVIVDVNATSNMFSSPFTNCSRVLNITFLVNNDGTPKTANWKSQTIDLTTGVGYLDQTYYKSYILNYNSGITADKEVKDDATYQALKNDPDWFSCDINYSRYNHDSAVRTINSLPDTSAYLATAGGTNTIKFKGASGALTDGGAINTLTGEEIAVATAKGWTVSLT